MTLRELMKAADACGLMWFKVIDGDTGARCFISSREDPAHVYTARRLADREVAEIAIEEGVCPDPDHYGKAVLAVKTVKTTETAKTPESTEATEATGAVERPNDGHPQRPSLKTDDVHYGDELRDFSVRMAREQSFTAYVTAHDAAEAERIAENFCEALDSKGWDAHSEHSHRTFEAEPAGDGRRKA